MLCKAIIPAAVHRVDCTAALVNDNWRGWPRRWCAIVDFVMASRSEVENCWVEEHGNVLAANKVRTPFEVIVCNNVK